jgi:hypothetical protein
MATQGKGDFRFRIRANPSPAAISKILGGLGEEFSDWRPAWQRMVPTLADGILENIDTRGASLGETWPAERDRYVRRKARQGFGRMELYRTGTLVSQLSPASGVRRMGRRSVSFGTKVPYGRAVNFGRNGARGRRFMGWSPRMKTAAEMVMHEHAQALLSKAAARIASLGQVAA